MSIKINIGYAFSFEIRGFLFNLDKNFLHLFYFIRFAVTEKMGWCRRLLLEVKGYYKKMSPFFSYFEDFIKKRPSFRILRTSSRNDPYRIFCLMLNICTYTIFRLWDKLMIEINLHIPTYIVSSWKGSERIESTRLWNKALVQKERLKRNSRIMKV